MSKITIKDVQELCNGIILNGDGNIEIKNVKIDTRKINKGDIFVAIENGNNYIETAMEKGVSACIVEKRPSQEILKKHPEITVVMVEDSIKTLQKLAQYKREQYNIPVIAITGSVGKTSTKDIVAKVVEQEYNVLKTEGNYNNHIGLPLTILRLEDHTALVVEMGMNHLGEIEVLTKIAKPTIAVITNVGTSHIGILGSRKNILKAKLEILEGLQENGTFIINNDNDMLHTCNKKAMTYGIENKSDIQAYDVRIAEDSSTYKTEGTQINVPISGTHFVYNSLCAIAVGKALGISMDKIKKGIEQFELTKKRMELEKIHEINVINDAYNASLESMKYALEYLKNVSGSRKIAVLGDMLELGEFSEELHKKVGEEVEKQGIEVLITVGEQAKNIASVVASTKEVYSYNTNEEAVNKLQEIKKEGDVILLKASNGMKFTEILDKLREG